MGVIGRGSLPSNYEDFAGSVTSALVLPQPEPQYVFAHWAMAGRLALAALNAGASSAQQYVSMVGGGAPVPPDLDRMARVADSYPGFVQALDKFGKGRGDTVKFQRPVFSTGGKTKAARKLTTDATISTTGSVIQAEEVPVVLEEYHGPVVSGASTPAPYAIWGFDAKYRANKLQLASVTSLHLRRDYVSWLDAVIRDEFLQSSNVTFPLGVSNGAGFVAGGGAKFSLEQIFRARKSLSDREWMRFPNGRYVCIVPTSFNTDMLEDVDYREMSKSHADGRNMLYGYIGSVQDIDFFECTTTARYSDDSGDIAAIEGSTIGANVTVQEALLVGPGVVGLGTAAPDPENVMGPVARFADDTNYGTVAKVIWYALHAFKMLDDRGVQRIVAQSA